MDFGVTVMDVSEPIVEAGPMQQASDSAASSSTVLAAARYVALTTFTRRQTAKHTPVWPVDVGDGRVGFITSSQTWKVRRIKDDCRVVLQPSDAKGRPGADTVAVPGSGEVVVGEAFEAVRRRVKEKYGYQLRIIDLVHAVPGRRTGHRNDCAVIVSFGAS